MIVQGKDISQSVRESADVCVIGSGCGGGATAKVLSAAGKKVIVVEEGGYFGPQDFQQSEEWAFTNLYQQRAGLATDDLGVTVLQGRCVGGSSTVNWTTSLRTPEFVLDFWKTERGLRDLSAKDLEPYFARVEGYLNIHQETNDRHNRQNRIILEGAGKLGYRSASNGRNVDGCLQLGVCGFGCPAGAKKSVDVTYIADAVAAGATVLSDARAERIEIDGGLKRVTGNILERSTRKPKTTFAIEAPTVVVAGSAVQSPVLLERSGLGGASGHLGKHLTFHLTSAVIGIYDSPQHSWKGIPQSAMCDEFLNANGDSGGFWIEAVPVGPVLAALAFPGFGREHRSIMQKLSYTAASIVLVKEIDSEGSVRSNDNGRPELTYERGPRDREYMKQGLAAAARIHFAAGARNVMTLHTRPTVFTSPDVIENDLGKAEWGTNDLSLYSAHPLGTCRMGEDARTSVVSSRGEVHGAPGIFVVDGSVMPSSLGVNPQVTILAISERNAERIAER